MMISSRQIPFRNARRGFSFVEVLFAVIILGVGFIMVAAVFPVALQQTKDTAEGVSAMAVTRSGVNLVAGVASDACNTNVATPYPEHPYDSLHTNVLPTYGKRYYASQTSYPTSRPTFETLDFLPQYKYSYLTYPPPAETANPRLYNADSVWINSSTFPTQSVNSFVNGQETVATNGNELYYLCADNIYAGNITPARSLFTYMSQNSILPEDPRAAFTMLYARDGYYNDKRTWGSQVKLVVIPLQARATSIFTNADTNPTMSFPNLRPHHVRFATLHNMTNATLNLTNTDLIIFDDTHGDNEAAVIDGPVGGDGGAAIEGACVVVENDNIVMTNGTADPTADDIGRYNGHTFRLGPRRADLDTQISSLLQSYQVVAGSTVTTNTAAVNTMTRGVVYELDSTTPMVTDAGADGTFKTADDIVALGVNTGNVVFGTTEPQSGVNYYGLSTGWLVGRGYADPSNPNKGFQGGNMAGTAYSTSVRIAPAN